MGLTLFGRGGGATTAPCGWWVVYTYEAPLVGLHGITDPASTTQAKLTNAGVTVNMWTDNSIIRSAAALALAGVASILY